MLEKEKNSFENVERKYEAREAKEHEMNEEAKAAATMERADFLVKEVKSSKQQIQNIMINITQVLQAIKDLRSQLQIAEHDNEFASVKHNEKNIQRLKEKIAGHKEEIFKMKNELIQSKITIELEKNPEQDSSLLEKTVIKEVDALFREIFED